MRRETWSTWRRTWGRCAESSWSWRRRHQRWGSYGAAESGPSKRRSWWWRRVATARPAADDISITAEVTTELSGWRHSILEQVWAVCANQTNRERCLRRLIMLCCFRMSLEHTLEKTASVSGPFIKCSLRKTIKRTALLRRLPGCSCLPRACSLRHSPILNLILLATAMSTSWVWLTWILNDGSQLNKDRPLWL